MYCNNCGAQIEPGTTFCPICGANQNSTAQQPMVGNTGNVIGDTPMAWYKFLIYFALFASTVLNVISGITMLTGAAYDGAADVVYRMFDGLQGLDTFVGVALLGIAGLCLYTRFRLSGFYRNGPSMLLAVYVVNVVVELIYIIGLNSILPSSVASEINASTNYAGMVVSVVMVFANIAYFKKRAHMFTN